MTAFLELKLKGNARAYIEAGSIAGIVTGVNMDCFTISSEKAPLALILRGGETLQVVEISAGLILSRAILARKRVRDEGLLAFVDYLGDVDADADAGRPAPETV